MKYLIEVPDETGQAYYNIAPYTEPSQKAIDLQHAHDIENVARMNYSKGAEDAWELAGDIAYRIMSYGDCLDANMLDKNEKYSSPNGVLDKLTYQEAKDKYDAWKKQREEINIGDEISCPGKLYVEAVVIGMDDDDDLYIIWKQSGKIDMIESSQRKHWVKTGICFPEVEELLKKMRER